MGKCNPKETELGQRTKLKRSTCMIWRRGQIRPEGSLKHRLASSKNRGHRKRAPRAEREKYAREPRERERERGTPHGEREKHATNRRVENKSRIGRARAHSKLKSGLRSPILPILDGPKPGGDVVAWLVQETFTCSGRTSLPARRASADFGHRMRETSGRDFRASAGQHDRSTKFLTAEIEEKRFDFDPFLQFGGRDMQSRYDKFL